MNSKAILLTVAMVVLPVVLMGPSATRAAVPKAQVSATYEILPVEAGSAPKVAVDIKLAQAIDVTMLYLEVGVDLTRFQWDENFKFAINYDGSIIASNQFYKDIKTVNQGRVIVAISPNTGVPGINTDVTEPGQLVRLIFQSQNQGVTRFSLVVKQFAGNGGAMLPEPMIEVIPPGNLLLDYNPPSLSVDELQWLPMAIDSVLFIQEATHGELAAQVKIANYTSASLQPLVLLVGRRGQELPGLLAPPRRVTLQGTGSMTFDFIGSMPGDWLAGEKVEVAVMLWSDWPSRGGQPLAKALRKEQEILSHSP